MRAYKLLRVRADGSIGPLFINSRQRIPVGVRLVAEPHRTKGFAFRPGWHCCSTPVAPHLSEKGRAWFVVEIEDWNEHQRPEAQGGLWFTAQAMTVLGPLPDTKPTNRERFLLNAIAEGRVVQRYGGFKFIHATLYGPAGERNPSARESARLAERGWVRREIWPGNYTKNTLTGERTKHYRIRLTERGRKALGVYLGDN